MKFTLPTFLLALVLCAANALAETFHAKATVTVPEERDPTKVEGSWSKPEHWAEGKVPASGKDVGIIANQSALTTVETLGAETDRPTIQIDPGGTLWMTQSIDVPIRLNGGSLREAGRRNLDLCMSPIEITADSTIGGLSSFDWSRVRFGGVLSNSKPVTLTMDCDVEFVGDSSKSLSARLVQMYGTLLLADATDTARLGGSEIVLYPGARLHLKPPEGSKSITLINNLSGVGSLRAGDHPRSHAIQARGIAIRPGLPDRPGTLSVAGNFEFAGSNKLIISLSSEGKSSRPSSSQLVIRGKLADSLDTVDLIIEIDPTVAPDSLANQKFVILSTTETDLSAFKPFRSITVRQGPKSGSATVEFKLDKEFPTGAVEVKAIAIPK